MIPRRALHPLRTASFLLLVAAVAAASGCGSKKKQTFSADNAELYREARDLIESRRFSEATQRLGDVGMVTPVAESLDPMVKLALADAYFFQTGTANAIEAQSRYEQFLNFYPLHAMSSYARFQAGACLLRQANDATNDQEFARRARDHFSTMIRDLPPNDSWRTAALQALARAQDMLAEHEWLVANFYGRKGKNLGKIERLSGLVENYPASSRRDQAMYELGRAYREVGDEPQARLAFERLLADYPQSRWADDAREALAELAAAPSPAAGGA